MQEYVKVEVVKGFEQEEIGNFMNELINRSADVAIDGVVKSINEDTFSIEFDREGRVFELYLKKDIVEVSRFMDYLEELGIPYKVYAESGMRSPSSGKELFVFDGVRSSCVHASESWEPLIPMSRMRNLIDLLEKSEEEEPYADIKALVIANEGWSETDINNMWRYGMENSIAFSHNFKKPDENTGVIDVEVEDGGTAEVTKQIDG